MAQNKKTIRLLFPQWQGGNNPDYVFGGELLAQIAPKSNTSKTFEVEVDADFVKKLEKEKGITGGAAISQQMEKTVDILERTTAG